MSTSIHTHFITSFPSLKRRQFCVYSTRVMYTVCVHVSVCKHFLVTTVCTVPWTLHSPHIQFAHFITSLPCLERRQFCVYSTRAMYVCACECVHTLASYYVAWTLHSLPYTVVTVVYSTREMYYVCVHVSVYTQLLISMTVAWNFTPIPGDKTILYM